MSEQRLEDKTKKEVLSDEKKLPEYRAVGLQGDHSLTVVVPKIFANVIGLRKGDFLRVTIDDQNRIIMERADK